MHPNLPIYYRDVVRPEWIDYNGHMTDGCYAVAFGLASERALEAWDLYTRYRAETHCTVYTAEMHLTFQRELREGDPIHAVTRVLNVDAKRIHVFHELYHSQAGYRAATCELLFLHVDQRIPRSVPMPPALLERLQRLAREHAQAPMPPEVGRAIRFIP